MRISLAILSAAVLLGNTPVAECQTEADINHDATMEYSSVNKEMEAAYKAAMKLLDTEGQRKLKCAQHAFIVFRDAQATIEADVVRGGTMSSAVYNSSRTELTRQQLNRLRSIAALAR